MQLHNLKGTQRLTFLSLLLAAAFILSWLEMMFGLDVGIPGIKLGLANIVILFTMCICGRKEALIVLVGRLILNALLFGNFVSLLYSVAGGLLSYIIMCLVIYVLKFGIILSSICGGVFHNIGQIIVAIIILNSTAIIIYIPYLIIGGIVAGALNGFIIKKLSKFNN